MPQPNSYENYPCKIILLSNLLSLSIYLIGAYITYKIGLVWLILYLLYILVLEIRLIKYHCVDCYYYGKYCAFGKGKLSSLFFKKGNPQKFVKNSITWKDLIPDLLVSLIPLIIGTVLLISDFRWQILILILLLIILATVGNGFVRSNLACKFCKQRTIGCPAERLFDKKRV